MEEHHPVLDRLPEHLTEYFGFGACEPTARLLIRELALEFDVLVGRQGFLGFDNTRNLDERFTDR